MKEELQGRIRRELEDVVTIEGFIVTFILVMIMLVSFYMAFSKLLEVIR